MLNVRTNSYFRIGEVIAFDGCGSCAESAIIVLVGSDRPAVTEKSRLLQRLSKCNVGTNALAQTFFVIISDNFFSRNI